MNHTTLILIGILAAIMLSRIFRGFQILAVGAIIGAFFFSGIQSDIPHSVGDIQKAEMSLSHDIGGSLAEQINTFKQGMTSQQNVMATPKLDQPKVGAVGSQYDGERIVSNDGYGTIVTTKGRGFYTWQEIQTGNANSHDDDSF